MNVHTQKSRQTDKQTNRQTDKQTDKVSDTVNLPPKRVSSADIASFSPSSEQIASA